MQLCPAPLHRGPFTLYSVCVRCPLQFYGSASPWLNAGSLLLLPQMEKEFITWRCLILTWMTIRWNTDFTGTVYSRFIFSLNYSVTSLLARCSMTRDPASLWSLVAVAGAPFWYSQTLGGWRFLDSTLFPVPPFWVAHTIALPAQGCPEHFSIFEKWGRTSWAQELRKFPLA